RCGPPPAFLSWRKGSALSFPSWGVTVMATSGRGGPSNDNLTDLLLGRRRPRVEEFLAVILAGGPFGSCLRCLGPALSRDPSGGVRAATMNNFQQIALALH